MKKYRLDKYMAMVGMVPTRSQAESYIKLGKVFVDGKQAKKPGMIVDDKNRISLKANTYVSRAALKLESVVDVFRLDFKGKTVLDVGSSKGGFTDLALKYGAKRVIAVDVGSGQMHPELANDRRVELREKTDIREVKSLPCKPDIILIDVSFISLRLVLPAVARLSGSGTRIVAMFKPQFETSPKQKIRGLVKNNRIRRKALSAFEYWLKENCYKIMAKADSKIAGAKGNIERFYLLKLIR